MLLDGLGLLGLHRADVIAGAPVAHAAVIVALHGLEPLRVEVLVRVLRGHRVSLRQVYAFRFFAFQPPRRLVLLVLSFLLLDSQRRDRGRFCEGTNVMPWQERRGSNSLPARK